MAQQAAAHVTRLEFDHDGFRALLTSPEMGAALQGIGDAIADDANRTAGLPAGSFDADLVKADRATRYRYPGRYMAIVSADTADARRAQAEHKVLSIAAAKPREV